jgi:hypothetical protein
MTTLREAALMALEALEDSCYPRASTKHSTRYDDAIDVLRKALDADSMASLPEPVACVQDLDEVKRKHLVYEKSMDWKDALYTAPPKREWQGLTHEERDEICKDFVGDDDRVGAYRSFALEVEVRLTEKNK